MFELYSSKCDCLNGVQLGLSIVPFESFFLMKDGNLVSTLFCRDLYEDGEGCLNCIFRSVIV